jgi:hypothetical protein
MTVVYRVNTTTYFLTVEELNESRYQLMFYRIFPDGWNGSATRLDVFDTKETAAKVADNFPGKYEYLQQQGFVLSGTTFVNANAKKEISVTHATDSDLTVEDFIKWYESAVAAG